MNKFKTTLLCAVLASCTASPAPAGSTTELSAPLFVEPKYEAPVPIEPPVAKYIEYQKRQWYMHVL